jgi:tetratricopeptide (TPR) repeat protein
VKHIKFGIKFFVSAAILMASCHSHADNYCGELANAYGPYDYRKGTGEFAPNLHLVEIAHFTSDVEQGIKGVSSYLGGDLDYTLRAFPNHHRALATMARVALKDKTVQVSGAKYPVECYFIRAIQFVPDDGVVHGAYGNYLFALGKTDKALVEFKQAVALEPENASINYNLGLALLKTKDFEQANKYAKKAYALGFPLPGLKNKLIEAGKWEDKPE